MYAYSFMSGAMMMASIIGAYADGRWALLMLPALALMIPVGLKEYDRG